MLIALRIVVAAVCVSVSTSHVRAADSDGWRDLQKRANDLSRQGKRDLAMQMAKAALALAEQNPGPDHPDVAAALDTVAMFYAFQQKYTEARPLLERALAIRERALGPDHVSVADTLETLGRDLSNQRNFSQAVQLFQRALVIREKAPEIRPEIRQERIAHTLGSLGTAYAGLGRAAEAEAAFKRSISLYEGMSGGRHTGMPWLLGQLADLYRRQGRLAEASALNARELEARKDAFARNPDDFVSRMNLSSTLMRQGRYTEAESMYREDLVRAEKTFGPDHPRVGDELGKLISLYRIARRQADEEILQQRRLAIYKKAYGPDDPNMAHALGGMAGLRIQQNRHADAEPYLLRALAIREKTHGPDDPQVGSLLQHLSDLYMQMGRMEDSWRYAARAAKIKKSSSK